MHLLGGLHRLPGLTGHSKAFRIGQRLFELIIPRLGRSRLFEKDGDTSEDVDTMVEPDISVVCDHDKLDKHGCKGAPDLVVEVLSPSTRRHDRLIKLDLYQRAGVKEYWIVDPDSQSVQVFLQDDNSSLRLHEDYGREDIAKVNVLDGCFIELSKVFPNDKAGV